MENKLLKNEKEEPDFMASVSSRRKFLGFTGVALGSAALLISGCKKDDDDTDTNGVNLGSGDTGLLNYAYALEQMESAFYNKVLDSPYSGISSEELVYLQGIRDGENTHREFFKRLLGSNAIKDLELDFSSVDFGSRASVLATASNFENTGVTAYNGAGLLLTDANNLIVAGKIVSVEARYAALLRDLLNNNSFASSDVVDAMGMDGSRTPMQVLSIVDPFIVTKLNASNLPS